MTTILSEFKKKDSTGKVRTYVEYNCDFCKKVHSKPKTLISEKNYCSQVCSAKDKQKNIKVNCAYCHQDFEKRLSSLKSSKSGLYFCSKNCKSNAQKLEGGLKQIQPEHYGTKEIGYRQLALENLDRQCNNCGYNKYEEVLEVHHIDFNHFNNNLLNLEILCPTCHTEKHLLSRTGKWRLK